MCAFSPCRGGQVSMSHLRTSLPRVKVPRRKIATQLTANSEHHQKGFANKSCAADSKILSHPTCRVKKVLFCEARRRGMSLQASGSHLYVGPNPQTRCSDEPLIPICSFFLQETQPPGPQLLSETCPSIISPRLPPAVTRILGSLCF